MLTSGCRWIFFSRTRAARCRLVHIPDDHGLQEWMFIYFENNDETTGDVSTEEQSAPSRVWR